jgi:hypothetical protein
MLRVKGNGNGISQNLLKTLRTNGAAFRIGPSGLRELRAHLDIQANSTDTQITVPRGEGDAPAELTSRL